MSLGVAKLVRRDRTIDEMFRRAALEHWHVQADSVEQAENDPALPKWNDPLAEPTGNSPTLRVKRISISLKPDSPGGDGGLYDAYIEYQEPGGRIESPTLRIPQWNIGTQSQRIEVDVHGLQIGSRYFGIPDEAIQHGSYDIATAGRIDPDAQVGADVLTPTLELSLTMPSFPAYKFSPGIVLSLMGRVNSSPVTIDGDTIPSDHLLFIGSTAEKIGTGQHQYRVVNHFRAAAVTNLPAGVPKFVQRLGGPRGVGSQRFFYRYEGGIDYPDTVAPIRYGFYQVNKAQKRDSAAGDFVDMDYDDLIDPNIEVANRVPREIVLFEAYPQADLTPVLGGNT